MDKFLSDPAGRSNPSQNFISRIRLIEGDITQQTGVDAIATAIDINFDTSRSLNRAIINAAGQELDDFIVENIYKPRIGDVHALPGFKLPVKNILVAFTPVWRAGVDGEDRDLLRCYRGIYETASLMKIKTLAIPAIGTGKHKFPVVRAARLALQAMKERMPDCVDELRIVCNKKANYDAFAERLRVMALEPEDVIKTSPGNGGGSFR